MEMSDFQKIRLVSDVHASAKNGKLTNTSINEMFVPNNSLNKIAIPVSSPSKKPLGKRKAFHPILAKMIPTPNWIASRKSCVEWFIFKVFLSFLNI